MTLFRVKQTLIYDVEADAADDAIGLVKRMVDPRPEYPVRLTEREWDVWRAPSARPAQLSLDAAVTIKKHRAAGPAVLRWDESSHMLVPE